MWKGLRACLAVPRGIMHGLNKAECHAGHFHNPLDVCNAQVLLIITLRNDGFMAQRLQ